MKRLTFFLPLLVFGVMVALFATMLTGEQNPREIRSVLVGRPAPDVVLPALYETEEALTAALFQGDTPVVLNFFASWCVPCRAEHESLMALAKVEGIRLVGVAYKDDPAKSRAFLAELGDPFQQKGVDREGRTAINWGVTGVPETFVIDTDGRVRYRHFGPIVGDSLKTRLMPEIEAVIK